MDQEIEYQQQQLHDIIAQQTSKMSEGLEDEYEELDELEVLDAMKGVTLEKESAPKVVTKVDPKQTQDQVNYDKLLADLLN